MAAAYAPRLEKLPFEDLLPLLVCTYQRGRLVPFIGAGMSAHRVVLWDEFVCKFESLAGLTPYQTAPDCPRTPKCLKIPILSNDARAQRAYTRLQNQYTQERVLERIREALEGADETVPAQTASLAQISWPLVITTNYDDLYYQARRVRIKEEGGDEDNLVILGRSPRDCKLVISSLTGPLDCQSIWHLQGLLGGFGEKMPTGLESLRDQLVIGHAEYRAVTNRSPEFRRCFGEVFNSRSLLFLGSSLKEEYFLNLFGEILDLCGPSSVPHFALTKMGEVDARFLASQMNITVCEFDDWPELPVLLDKLAKAITQPATKTVRHTYSVHADTSTTIDIVDSRNPPVEPKSHEAVFFVAQKKDKKRLAPPPFEHLDLTAWPVDEQVFRIGDSRVFAVTARCRDNATDDAVSSACQAVLSIIGEMSDISKLHFYMPLEGGSVPPVFGFIEVLRTFGEWKRNNGKSSPLHLIVYGPSGAELNINAARIDIHELLNSPHIRFWAVVCANKNREPIRRPVCDKPNTTFCEILEKLDIPRGSRKEWLVTITPSPRRKTSESRRRRAIEMEKLTLTEAGIVFGSVVLLEYDSEHLDHDLTP
jgi:hypothetical protein